MTRLTTFSEAGGAIGVPVFIRGRYYDMGHAQKPVSSVSNQPFANYVAVSPIFIPNDVTIDRLAMNVTVASAGTIRLGLYATGADGYPSDLVVDGGTINSGTTGPKEVTISEELSAGWYWTAYNSSGNPTLTSYNYTTGPVGFSAPNTAYNEMTLLRALSAASALPNPFGTPDLYHGLGIRVFIRVAP